MHVGSLQRQIADLLHTLLLSGTHYVGSLSEPVPGFSICKTFPLTLQPVHLHFFHVLGMASMHECMYFCEFEFSKLAQKVLLPSAVSPHVKTSMVSWHSIPMFHSKIIFLHLSSYLLWLVEHSWVVFKCA